MTFDRFKGVGDIPGYIPTDEDRENSLRNPNGYRAGKDLARAVNVALALDMPLLVTGEPGTGKTQLAYRMAAELALGEVLRFDTKSSSQATELFYRFDSVREFGQSQLSAAHNAELPKPQEFLHIQALGQAILLTLDPVEVKRRTGVECGHASNRSIVFLDRLNHPGDGLLVHEGSHGVVNQHDVVLGRIDGGDGIRN